MKKIVITAIALFMGTAAWAQLSSTLIVHAQPPAQLSEWGDRREVLTLIVSGQGAAAGPFKVKTEIKLSDGTVIATSDLAKTATFTPNPGSSTILTANDVMPLEFMMFTGKYKTSLQRTGKLPADNYMICTQPVNPVDYRILGEERCKSFYLASTQLPVLLKPYNEEVLDGKKAQTAIIFRWSPVVPTQSSPVTYRLQVFEVMPKQNPVQAMRSNQPVLDKEIVAATQFIWQPQLAFMPPDTLAGRMPAFVWTIQSLDKAGLPVTQTDGSGEARSEPVIFYVDPQKGLAPKIAKESQGAFRN